MTVLLSSEVAEEIEELLYLIRSTSPEEQIVIHAPDSVLRCVDLGDRTMLRTISVRHHAHRARVIPKLVGFGEFALLAIRSRPRLIVSGFSMLKHRAMSRVLGVPHVSYIRGLMFNPETHLGISDKIRFGLARGKNVRLLNAFEADAVLTVARINEDFMVTRGIDRDRIVQVGPVWLRDVPPAPSGFVDGRIFFVTKAFEAHGADDAHERQVSVVHRLVASLPGRVAIRAHPRDYYDYEADPLLRDVFIDRSSPRAFLHSLIREDLLISPLSTLAFEALHVGVPVLFFTADGVTDDLLDAYSRLNIDAVDLASVVERVEEGTSAASHGVAPVFSVLDVASATRVLRERVIWVGSERKKVGGPVD